MLDSNRTDRGVSRRLLRLLRMAIGVGLSSILVIAFTNCTGRFIPYSGSSSSSGAGLPEENPFRCDSNEPPPAQDAVRISKLQYLNSVRSLFARALGDSDAAALMTSVGLMSLIPEDSVAPFSRSDSNFSALHARAFFDAADLISTRILAAANYTRFVSTFINYNRGTCSFTSAANLDSSCRETLVRNFVLRAWGRPIEDSDLSLNNELVSFLNEFTSATSTAAGVEAMVFKVLLSPQFLNHLNISVQLASGNVYRLSSYAIARELSLALVDDIPSEGLLAFAGSNDLMTDSNFTRAVELIAPLMDSPARVFADEFLRLNKMPRFSSLSDPKFQYISQGIAVGDSLLAAMRTEVLDLVSYVRSSNKNYREIFTSDISFARDPNLMKIYSQTSPAPASVNDSNAVRFPAGQRSGLLTRAAMLVSGKESENPVLRGIHIRRDLLCIPTPLPPPSLGNLISPPEPDPNLTTRQRYEQKTSSSVCAGCHRQINPSGFPLGKYNALGGYQPVEPIFFNGQLTKNLPVDSVVDMTEAYGSNVKIHDGVELNSFIADRPEFKKCLTQNFYAFSRNLPLLPSAVNSCAMSAMYDSLTMGEPLQSFLVKARSDVRLRYRQINK